MPPHRGFDETSNPPKDCVSLGHDGQGVVDRHGIGLSLESSQTSSVSFREIMKIRGVNEMFFVEYRNEFGPKSIFVEKQYHDLIVGILRLRYEILAETFIEF